MQLGVLQFGNGEILADGTVSPAIMVQELTNDFEAVKGALEGLEYRKGFTNMAQAFAMSEKMWVFKGRKNALQALLTITDGKPSFLFQAQEMVSQLDDKGVQRFFLVVSDDKGVLETINKWASSPWETNVLHIPGLDVLAADDDAFVEKALVMFCPLAESPSREVEKEEKLGFMILREGAVCGQRGPELTKEAPNVEACATIAREAGYHAFVMGVWFKRGFCYGSPVQVNPAQYEEWSANRENPACPEEDGWVERRLFDFYALEPPAE